MQSEPEVCADSDGGRVLFTFHPAVLELFVFFSWAPVLLAQDRGDLGYTASESVLHVFMSLLVCIHAFLPPSRVY